MSSSGFWWSCWGLWFFWGHRCHLTFWKWYESHFRGSFHESRIVWNQASWGVYLLLTVCLPNNACNVCRNTSYSRDHEKTEAQGVVNFSKFLNCTLSSWVVGHVHLKIDLNSHGTPNDLPFITTKFPLKSKHLKKKP